MHKRNENWLTLATRALLEGVTHAIKHELKLAIRRYFRGH